MSNCRLVRDRLAGNPVEVYLTFERYLGFFLGRNQGVCFQLGSVSGQLLKQLTGQADGLQSLKEMYDDWPFFRAMIDNAELALVKSDLGVSTLYAELASKTNNGTRIASMIRDEYSQAIEVVCRLLDSKLCLTARLG